METVENDFMKFWIENDILFSVYKNKVVIDLEKAKQSVDLRREISKQRDMLWCFNLDNLKSMTREARDYVTKNGQENITASAVIVKSHLTRFIFNAYLKINRPDIPTKAFSGIEDGTKWISQFKK